LFCWLSAFSKKVGWQLNPQASIQEKPGLFFENFLLVLTTIFKDFNDNVILVSLTTGESVHKLSGISNSKFLTKDASLFSTSARFVLYIKKLALSKQL
jgi:hypothetical protein